MRYREIPPPAPLADTVACLWLLEAPADPAASPEPVLPDGCPELIVQLGDPYLRSKDGAERLQRRVFVVGPTTSALWLRPAGRTLTLGVRFRPGSGCRVLGPDLAALRDGEVPLDLLWGSVGAELAERLQGAADADGAVSLAVPALVRLHARGKPPHAGAAWAVEEVLRRRGRVGVEDLARRSGWSRRHLEREVARAAGMRCGPCGGSRGCSTPWSASNGDPARAGERSPWPAGTPTRPIWCATSARWRAGLRRLTGPGRGSSRVRSPRPWPERGASVQS